MMEKAKEFKVFNSSTGAIETLEVYPDESAENSRQFENLGTMVCWHRRHRLGDSEKTGVEWNEAAYRGGPGQFLAMLAGGPSESDNLTPAQYAKRLAAAQKRVEMDFVILPLYLFDHSGITISTQPFGDPWDSGMVGWIYVSMKRINCEFGIGGTILGRRQLAEKALQGEVKIYDDCLRGEVYGYIKKSESGEELDSCWGYYGSDLNQSGLLENALTREQHLSLCMENGWPHPADGKKPLTKMVKDNQVLAEDGDYLIRKIWPEDKPANITYGVYCKRGGKEWWVIDSTSLRKAKETMSLVAEKK